MFRRVYQTESYTTCSHKHERDADIKINVAVAVFWQTNLFVLTFRQMTALAGMQVLTVYSQLIYMSINSNSYTVSQLKRRQISNHFYCTI